MSTQTDCVFSQFILKEESLKILDEKLSLKQFKTLEQSNFRKAENSRVKCQLDIQSKLLDEKDKDLK